MLHDRGNFGERFGYANAGDPGFDGLCGTTVGVSLLWIECLELAGAAGHPEQNAGLWWPSSLLETVSSQTRQPTGGWASEQRQSTEEAQAATCEEGHGRGPVNGE